MNPEQGNQKEGAVELIDVVIKKLEAHQHLLEKSLQYGRLVWRYNRRSRRFEVDLELKL
jgi:hypothetical protein